MNERPKKRRGLIGLLQENRRFRFVVAGTIGLPALYALSFGPACWISSHCLMGQAAVSTIYRPLGRVCAANFAQPDLQYAMQKYSRLGAADGWQWVIINRRPEWWGQGRPRPLVRNKSSAANSGPPPESN
jgi:hypothetical protein